MSINLLIAQSINRSVGGKSIYRIMRWVPVHTSLNEDKEQNQLSYGQLSKGIREL